MPTWDKIRQLGGFIRVQKRNQKESPGIPATPHDSNSDNDPELGV
jgi:hypothetical protein